MSSTIRNVRDPRLAGRSGHRKVMGLAVKAGEVLLENGAEIDRVQQTIIHILRSFGVQDYHVYVISNGIFVTVNEGGEDPCNAVRYVKESNLHLGRIAAVNKLSREIAAGMAPGDIDSLRQRLDDYAGLPLEPAVMQVLACAIGSACFCYILGGSMRDSFAVLLAGSILKLFLMYCGKIKLTKYIVRITGGILATLMCGSLYKWGVGESMDPMIIGVIMSMVPGVLLTTAIRDFFNSDYISGVIHLIDALLIAACLALGVTTGLWIWSKTAGGMA